MKKNKSTSRKKRRRLNPKKAFLFVATICIFVLLFKMALKINVANIEVIGNEYVSDAEVIKLAHLNDKTSFLGLNTKEACNNIKVNELVDTCRIKRKLLFKLSIEIEENRPLFYYANVGKLVLSNSKEVDYNNIYGVPTLINYVPEKVLLGFISGLKAINSDIIRSISEIEYSPSKNSDGTFIDDERFMLSMKDGNIVYVNNRKIDVLASYDKIIASVGDKRGYYNLDSDYNNYYFEEFTSER